MMFVKKHLDEFKVPCTLFIWYMPYSRMDRKIEGDVFTLKYMCDFINWLKFEKVIVMEPHSEKTIQMLERVTDIYPVTDWIKDVQEKIGFTEKDHIVFPDRGAFLRYGDMEYKNVCIMEKKRNPITGKIEYMGLREGQVNLGSKCIIIDDICSKGGTAAWASKILRELGASEVYLLIAHCEKTVLKVKLLEGDCPFDKVYTSKSIMNRKHPKIEYLDFDVKNSLHNMGKEI